MLRRAGHVFLGYYEIPKEKAALLPRFWSWRGLETAKAVTYTHSSIWRGQSPFNGLLSSPALLKDFIMLPRSLIFLFNFTNSSVIQLRTTFVFLVLSEYQLNPTTWLSQL
jgi:hypothetical protein